MSLLDFIPTSWLMPAAGAAVCALGALLGVQTWRLHSEQAAHGQDRALIAEERLLALRATATQEAKDRAEEQRRHAKQQDALDAAEADATRARADRAISDAAAGRLQLRITALVAAAKQAAGNPKTGEAGPAAGDAAGMLADVLGRCAARVQLLADLADQRGTAGQFCERSYDSLTPAPTEH